MGVNTYETFKPRKAARQTAHEKIECQAGMTNSHYVPYRSESRRQFTFMLRNDETNFDLTAVLISTLYLSILYTGLDRLRF